MALHPAFPRSPYEPLLPDQRWFPADEALRDTAYEKLLPPLVAKIRREVQAWRDAGYAGASATSIALLRWWFDEQEVLTKHWTDWIDYWAVDFDYESRREVIRVPKNFGVEGALPGMADSSEFVEFEEQWTGSYIFENEWQSFRTRRDRTLELTSAPHVYARPGRYVIATKVIDIFGNDTMSLTTLSVG